LVNSDFTENFGAVLSTEGSYLFPVYRDELGKQFLLAARLDRVCPTGNCCGGATEAPCG